MSEKDKVLAGAIAQIEKSYGKGSIMKLNQDLLVDVPVISTGNIAIDKALGTGGLPRGRIIEVFGPESSGKTTLCLHVIAEAQKLGGTVAFVDAEHALDPQYARELGVQTDKLLLSQPDYGEQALEIVDILVRSQALDLIVIDSVAALTPKAEIQGEMGDSHMGLQARLMSQALRKLTASVSKSNTMVIFINQLRHKIGMMFGNPETTTGGNALKFYSSIRIEIRRKGWLKKDDEIYGANMRVKIVKNKLAPPFGEAEVEAIYGEGFTKYGTLLDLSVAEGFINKSGAWYSYNGKKMGQGKEAGKQFLKDNPEICHKLEAQLRKKFKLKPQVGDEDAINSSPSETKSSVEESVVKPLEPEIQEAAKEAEADIKA